MTFIHILQLLDLSYFSPNFIHDHPKVINHLKSSSEQQATAQHFHQSQMILDPCVERLVRTDIMTSVACEQKTMFIHRNTSVTSYRTAVDNFTRGATNTGNNEYEYEYE